MEFIFLKRYGIFVYTQFLGIGHVTWNQLKMSHKTEKLNRYVFIIINLFRNTEFSLL